MKLINLFNILIILMVLIIYNNIEPKVNVPFVKANTEVISPSDYIQDSNIYLEESQLTLYIENAFIAKFADTNSMDPLLDVNSHGIEIKPKYYEDLQVGDVIAYEPTWTQGIVIHRIVHIGKDQQGWYAITKGDNNNENDPGRIRFEQVKFILIGVLY